MLTLLSMNQSSSRADISRGQEIVSDSVAKSTRSNKLKRLSDTNGPIYRGLNPLRNTQRAFISDPKHVFDFDSPNPSATSRTHQRIPSIHPDSLSWDVRNTSHDLNTRKIHPAEPPEMPIPRRRGRPPKVRPENTDQHAPMTNLSSGAPGNLKVTRKRGRPRRKPLEYQGEGLEAAQISQASSNKPRRDSDQDDNMETIQSLKKHKVDADVVDDDRESDLFVPVDNDSEPEQILGRKMTEIPESDYSDMDPIVSDPTFLLVPGLQTAFKALDKVGLSDGKHKIRHKLPSVRSIEAKAVLAACMETDSVLDNFGDPGQDSASVPKDLRAIASGVEQVRQSVVKIIRMQSWDTRTIARDVYVHVLPGLIRLLKSLLKHMRPGPNLDSSYHAWSICQIIMINVAELGSKFTKAKSDIVTAFSIKGLVKYQIVNNVQRALETLRNHLLAHEDEVHRRRRSEKREEQQRRKYEEDRKLAMKDRALRDWEFHWASLHDERYRAEESRFLHRSKVQHLLVVPLVSKFSTSRELDANGEPFERVEILAKRQSQPQSRHRVAWTEDEQHDLLEGLRETLQDSSGTNPVELYVNLTNAQPGQDVYKRIFWNYCRRGQSLNAYNVSEIVEQAVLLRDKFVQHAQQAGEPVFDWIPAIPDPREPPDLEDL